MSAFVPKGFVSFPDAVALFAERRIARAVGGDGAPDAAMLADAARWLHAEIVGCGIGVQFVADRIGTFDVGADWFARVSVDDLARDGRPRHGYVYKGVRIDGRVVVNARHLTRAIDMAHAARALERARRMGGVRDPRVVLPGDGRTGRPKTYDFEWLALEVAAIVHEGLMPASQGALIRLLQERHDARFGTMPDESTLRPLARRAFERLRR
jgi:hypothetical protein